MKKTLLLLLASINFIPDFAQADIIFSAGEGVSILAVNGKAVDQGTLFSDTPDISAPNGKAQILVEYTAEMGRSADDYLIEKSDTFVITLSATDTRVQVSAPEISSRYELKAFNRSAQWLLQDAEGKTLPFVYGKLKKEGFQLGRNYENELKSFNNSQDPAALPYLNRETYKFNTSSPAQVMPESTATDQKMVSQMLQFWYEQANKETRNQFKSWIQSGQ